MTHQKLVENLYKYRLLDKTFEDYCLHSVVELGPPKAVRLLRGWAILVCLRSNKNEKFDLGF
eukprot:403361776